ncbi:MFS transporter [Clavibacter michiganensis subsp. phaseoli]|uniref:MFS transporter n=1 Tax=Clavibacter phaseoli TaxID=1734031 RepID=A0A8I0S7W3_9MICO|nr:MFS transporter [Clavibacter phaseoli]MBF4631132.1 MFS transporter [Clavibacter phaseoli]
MSRPRMISSLALVVTCFLAGMALSTAPTPLYPAYEARFGIGPSGVTLLFAGFAVGAIASLLASLRVLRGVDLRAVVALAAGIEAVAAAALALLPTFGGFAAGRVLTGIGVGVLASTIVVVIGRIASAGPPSRAAAAVVRVAPALSMTGLALGPLVAGAAAPTDPSGRAALYLAFAAVLAAGAVAAPLVIPRLPAGGSSRPAGSAPAATRDVLARPRGWALVGAFLAFSVTGLFGALAPTLLGALAGDVSVRISAAVVASVFLAGAVAPQVVPAGAVGIRGGAVILVGGVALVAVATAAGILGLFVAGGLVSGSGAGIVFSASLRAALADAAPAGRPRASTLVFAAAYAGLAVPVVGIGMLLGVLPAAAAAVLFAVAMGAGALVLWRTAPRAA